MKKENKLLVGVVAVFTLSLTACIFLNQNKLLKLEDNKISVMVLEDTRNKIANQPTNGMYTMPLGVSYEADRDESSGINARACMISGLFTGNEFDSVCYDLLQSKGEFSEELKETLYNEYKAELANRKIRAKVTDKLADMKVKKDKTVKELLVGTSEPDNLISRLSELEMGMILDMNSVMNSSMFVSLKHLPCNNKNLDESKCEEIKQGIVSFLFFKALAEQGYELNKFSQTLSFGARPITFATAHEYSTSKQSYYETNCQNSSRTDPDCVLVEFFYKSLLAPSFYIPIIILLAIFTLIMMELFCRIPFIQRQINDYDLAYFNKKLKETNAKLDNLEDKRNETIAKIEKNK